MCWAADSSEVDKNHLTLSCGCGCLALCEKRKHQAVILISLFMHEYFEIKSNLSLISWLFNAKIGDFFLFWTLNRRELSFK